jgi:hypothetical protein
MGKLSKDDLEKKTNPLELKVLIGMSIATVSML